LPAFRGLGWTGSNFLIDANAGSLNFSGRDVENEPNAPTNL
jgi:hypothetical protein